MRVTHLRLPKGEMFQTENGPLQGTLVADGPGGGYQMYFLGRYNLVEVNRPHWTRPVYISAVGCAFSTEEPLRKTGKDNQS